MYLSVYVRSEGSGKFGYLLDTKISCGASYCLEQCPFIHHVSCSHGRPKRSSPCFFFILFSSSVKSHYVFLQSVKVTGTEALGQRLYCALQSVMIDCMFPPGLPLSVGTSHVLLGPDQVLLGLSSSVKVLNTQQ